MFRIKSSSTSTISTSELISILRGQEYPCAKYCNNIEYDFGSYIVIKGSGNCFPFPMTAVATLAGFLFSNNNFTKFLSTNGKSVAKTNQAELGSF